MRPSHLPFFSFERRWFQCQMDRQACSIAPTGSAYSHGLCDRVRPALIAALFFSCTSNQRAQLNLPAVCPSLERCVLQESPQFSCERRFWFQCQMERQACSIAPTGSAYSHGLCDRTRLALIAAMLFLHVESEGATQLASWKLF